MAVGRGENKSDWGVNMQHSFSIYDRQVGCIFFFWRSSSSRFANSNRNALAKVNCRAIFVCINNGKFVIHIILIALAISSEQQMTKNICCPRGQMRVKTAQMTQKERQKTAAIFIYTKRAGQTKFDLNQMKYLNIKMLASAEWIMAKYFHNYLGQPMKY